MTIIPRLCLCTAGVALVACSDPEAERARRTTVPTYDQRTGKLTQLTYDRNKNGTIDTWTDMDGTRPLRSRVDLDEDGKIDRWEYYDAAGHLEKVGFSRANNGKVDAWAFSDRDGKIARIEISSTGDEHRIDRWEFYENTQLARVEADTDGDGRVDRWETYEKGSLKTAAIDENRDGKPDRRLVYDDGVLIAIESEPDAAGRFTKRVDVK